MSYFYVEGLSYIPSPKCAYPASKHGVVGFTRCYAKIAIESGVRLNCICPSFVDTDMVKDLAESGPGMKQYIAKAGVC
ncbi:SDR family oxidoreductase, partial [Paramuricea clavata]